MQANGFDEGDILKPEDMVETSGVLESEDAVETSEEIDAEFEIVLKEDESVLLYSSPRLPIGSFTKKIPLKKHLEPGKYDCVAKYTLYKPNTEEKAGNVRVGLTINIGK